MITSEWPTRSLPIASFGVSEARPQLRTFARERLQPADGVLRRGRIADGLERLRAGRGEVRGLMDDPQRDFLRHRVEVFARRMAPLLQLRVVVAEADDQLDLADDLLVRGLRCFITSAREPTAIIRPSVRPCARLGNGPGARRPVVDGQDRATGPDPLGHRCRGLGLRLRTGRKWSLVLCSAAKVQACKPLRNTASRNTPIATLVVAAAAGAAFGFAEPPRPRSRTGAPTRSSPPTPAARHTRCAGASSRWCSP